MRRLPISLPIALSLTFAAMAACAAPADDEAAARAAWSRKLQAWQQCKARQRAPSYGPAASAASAPRVACADPGPYVPPGTAKKP